MDLMARRRIMMEKKALPYDAEIEYLESTGTQYIDTLLTLVAGTTKVTVDFDVKFNDVSGASKMCFISTPNSGLQIYTNSNRLFNQTAALNVNSSTRYVCRVETTATTRYIQVGALYTSVTFSRSISDGAEIYVIGKSTAVDSSKARWYSITLSLNDTVVRDFIPVRVGSVGYMYDRVSGQLFGNAGTGNFILGPDIN